MLEKGEGLTFYYIQTHVQRELFAIWLFSLIPLENELNHNAITAKKDIEIIKERRRPVSES